MAKKTELQSIPRSWASDAYVGSNSLGDASVLAAAIAAGAVVNAGLGAGAVTGAKASAAVRNKACEATVPTIGTTGAVEVLLLVPQAGTVNGVNFVFKDALAQHASNYVALTVVNKGQAGSGTTAVLAASDLNTTKTSTGLAIGAYTARGTVLSAVGGALTVAQYDVLAVTITSNGTLANTLTEGHVLVQIDVTI